MVVTWKCYLHRRSLNKVKPGVQRIAIKKVSAAREIFIEKDSEDSIDISLGIQDNRQNMINLSRAVCEDVDFIDDILPCPFSNILKNEKILRQQVENSVCCYRS